MLGLRSDRETLRRRVVERMAYDLDLEFHPDLSRRAETGSEEALQLVSCGFELLHRVTKSDAFPSLNSRTRKRGTRLIRGDIAFGGGTASTFLISALTRLLARTGPDLTPDKPPREPGAASVHRELSATLEDFYRLKGRKGTPLDLEALLGECLAEYRVMEEHRLDGRLINGRETATRYAALLMAEEDPDSDPDVVEEHRLYARDYFLNMATVRAVALSLESASQGSRWRLVKDDLLRLGRVEPDARKVKSYRKRLLAAWREGSSAYFQYATLAAGAKAPVGGASPDGGPV